MRLSLFCIGGQRWPPLDKQRNMDIIKAGDAATSGQPLWLSNLKKLRNRHRAGWRFLLFSFWTRIEIE